MVHKSASPISDCGAATSSFHSSVPALLHRGLAAHQHIIQPQVGPEGVDIVALGAKLIVVKDADVARAPSRRTPIPWIAAHLSRQAGDPVDGFLQGHQPVVADQGKGG